MPRETKQSTRAKILVAALELMESAAGVDGVTMRRVAASAGVTAMATYKHFRDRDALLRAATAAEYPRIASYFARANARTEVRAAPRCGTRRRPRGQRPPRPGSPDP